MEALFLRLNEDQVSALRTNAVAFYPFFANGEQGITIDDVDQDAAQLAIGMNIIRNSRTDYEGIVECVLMPIPGPRVNLPIDAEIIRRSAILMAASDNDIMIARRTPDTRLVFDNNGYIVPEEPTDLNFGATATVAEPPIPAVVSTEASAPDTSPTTGGTKSYTVTTANWANDNYGKSSRYVDLVTRILLPVINRNIKINYRENQVRIKSTNGNSKTLSIHLGEGTWVDGAPDTYQHVFDQPIGRRKLYKTEGPGRILTNTDGLEFAQVEANDIWVLFHLGATDSSIELNCFKKVLEAIVEELSMTDEQREKLLIQREQAKREKTKRDYVSSCATRIDRIIRVTKKQIEVADNDLRMYERELVSKIRHLGGLRAKLPQLEASKNKDTTKYEKEYDKLLSIRCVNNVEVNGDVVNVFTDTIYCMDDRTNLWHEIGRFRIEINLGQYANVKFFNLDRMVNGFAGNTCHHPHVFHIKGEACLGTVKEIFPSLLATYEVAAIIVVAIQFLESANTQDGAGAHINAWPLYNGDGKTAPDRKKSGSGESTPIVTKNAIGSVAAAPDTVTPIDAEYNDDEQDEDEYYEYDEDLDVL